jgi:hypothetical protein
MLCAMSMLLAVLACAAVHALPAHHHATTSFEVLDPAVFANPENGVRFEAFGRYGHEFQPNLQPSAHAGPVLLLTPQIIRSRNH